MRFVLCAVVAFLVLALASAEKKVVCYFRSSSVYRPGHGKFNISNIEPNLCTHLIYAFAGITDTGKVRVLDTWQDLPDHRGRNGFGRFNNLRNSNPNLKTLISIGGWEEGSTRFSKVMRDSAIRLKFVDDLTNFVKNYGFDGCDIFWVYPNQRGGDPEDKRSFVNLLKEIRERFDAEGLILSAAVDAFKESAAQSYIIPEVAKYVHFINVLSIDFHGFWDKKTGINAPLYPRRWESEKDQYLNINASIHYWLEQGAPANKIVVGIPFFGRSFTLANVNNKEIGAPAIESGTAGNYTREAGFLGYIEICLLQIRNHWDVFYDDEQRVPYAIRNDQWVGYDNEKSIKEKAEFINSLGLGGAMVWSIDTDDFASVCAQKYPLLNALNAALKSDSSIQPTEDWPALTIDETDVDNDVVCKSEGYVRHPKKCETFFYCAWENDSIKPIKFECARGMLFDLGTNVCNLPKYVQC